MKTGMMIWTETLGWMLLHAVWQVALIAGLAAVLLAGMRNRHPRGRYALALIALLACWLVPVATVLSGWGVPQVLSMDAWAAIGSPVSAVAEPGWMRSLRAWMPALVCGWLAGVLLMGSRVVIGLWWLRRLVRQSSALQGELSSYVRSQLHKLGERRAVRVLAHPQVTAMLTTGLLKPVILVPSSLLTGMDPQMLQALLAHEAAHISRWDYLFLLLQQGIQTCLFFHPGVWWLCRQIDKERELIADDIARQLTGDGRQLALALQQLDQWQLAAQQHGLAAHGGDLLSRIRRLVRPEQQHLRWRTLAPAFVSVMLALAGGGLWQPAVAERGGSPAPLQRESAAVRTADVAPVKNTIYVDTHSSHALVMDEASGQVLLEKAADTVVPMASISKLMTAMLVLDSGSAQDQMLAADATDLRDPNVLPMKLKAGMSLSRADWLALMLIPSSNQAANVLARHFPGGEKAFYAAAQRKMQALGMRSMQFVSPSGVDEANVASARDIALLLKAAASYPDIRRLTTTPELVLNLHGKPQTFQHSNQLVGDRDWQLTVTKTGYSRKAGRCLSMMTSLNGRRVLIVLMHADSAEQRTEDARQILQQLQKSPVLPQGATMATQTLTTMRVS